MEPTKESIKKETKISYKNVKKQKDNKIFSFYGGVYDLSEWFEIHEKNIPTALSRVEGELLKNKCGVFYRHIFKEHDKSQPHKSLDLLICFRIGSIPDNDNEYNQLLKKHNMKRMYPTVNDTVGMQPL